METDHKTFDCLAFKAASQRDIMKELEGLSPAEQREHLRRAAEEGPLGDWWKKTKAALAAARERSDSAR